MTKKVVYLASPYTGVDQKQEAYRYEMSIYYAAEVMKIFDVTPLSSVVYCHPINRLLGAGNGGFDFWGSFSVGMMASCEELWVMDVPGARQSTAILAEISYAQEAKKPVKFLTFNKEGELTLHHEDTYAEEFFTKHSSSGSSDRPEGPS